VWRFSVAEILAMLFAAFTIQSARGPIWLQRQLAPNRRLLFCAGCFALLAWAIFQMALTLPTNT
jgi:hypothetical protein